MNYTPQQFADKLDKVASGLPRAIALASLEAGQQLRAEIPARIHNASGTKDIKGATRKYISKSYVKKRSKKGLQTSVVDNTFTGNLQRSYGLVTKKTYADVIVKGDKNIDKVKGNERYYDSPVWEASEGEVDKAVEVFKETVLDYIRTSI